MSYLVLSSGCESKQVLPREIWLREYTSSSLDEQVIYYFYENDVSSC